MWKSKDKKYQNSNCWNQWNKEHFRFFKAKQCQELQHTERHFVQNLLNGVQYKNLTYSLFINGKTRSCTPLVSAETLYCMIHVTVRKLSPNLNTTLTTIIQWGRQLVICFIRLSMITHLMCSGVVPQQPPMMFTSPSLAKVYKT